MDKIGFYRKDSNLYSQNIRISKLVEKYGSPLFIYDASIIEKNFFEFMRCIKNVDGKIHYAVKANDSLGIIKFLKNLGAGADIVSVGEMLKCLKIGLNPNKIIFSGVGKQKEEIEFAIKNKIKQINIESIEELYDIVDISNKLKITTNLAIRVNFDIKTSTHRKISTGDEKSKFGISLKEIPEIYKIISNSKYLKPYGLAVHIGSQIFDYKL